MRKGFTLIELMICIAIVAVIAAIAIPNIMEKKLVGHDHMWRGQRVHVLARDMNTTPSTYIVRTATGEVHVQRDELTPVNDVEKP